MPEHHTLMFWSGGVLASANTEPAHLFHPLLFVKELYNTNHTYVNWPGQ